MAKKKKKNRKPVQLWKLYEARGELKRKNKSCPKCGPGHFMAEHSNRVSCGKCGYAEIRK